MRDYLNTLEGQLLELAHATEDRKSFDTAPTRRRALVRAAIPTVAALVAVIVGGLTIWGGPAAAPARAVPVLARQAVDLTNSQVANLLRRNNVDLREARRIATPTGTGYVVPDHAESRFCLVVPDPVDGYGNGCSTLEQIQRRGLVSVVSPPAGDPSRPATFVVVLPDTADAPTVAFKDGTSMTLRLRDGIATLETRQDATVSYKTAADTPATRLRIRATNPAADSGP